MSGHTKGRVEVVEESGCGFVVHPVDDPDSIICTEIGLFSGAGQADAALIAEAFNVADETGRTPQQLADERAELFNALERLRDHCNHGAWAGAAMRAAVVADLVVADALLAKVKGPVQS